MRMKQPGTGTEPVDTFLADRVRPTSGSLQDCHLLLRNLRGYQLV